MNTHQRRLDKAIDSWPHWQCDFKARPRVLKKISGGYTNSSYLAGCNEHIVVLRLNHSTPDALGISRTNEYCILKALSCSGIAPKIVYWPASMDFAILEFIEGRVWTNRDYRLPSQRQRLLHVIDKYRTFSMSIEPFSYAIHLNNYWRHFKKKRPGKAHACQKEWFVFIRQLRLYEKINKERVLAHHDLVPENIIESDSGIRIIDWEYAGLGIPVLDQYSVVKHSSGVLNSSHLNMEKYSMAKHITYWLDKFWWGIR